MQISTPTPARRIAQLGPRCSALRLSVTRWALAQGHRLDYDALTVIVAVKAESGVPIERWTADDVWQLWWIDLSDWCARRGLHPPEGLSTTMLTLFKFLDSTGSFGGGSDSMVDLEEAMETSGATPGDVTPLTAG